MGKDSETSPSNSTIAVLPTNHSQKGSTYRGQVVNRKPKLPQSQSVTKHETPPVKKPNWECKHDTREFHSNEFHPVFPRRVWGQKHPWEVCDCRHIGMIYLLFHLNVIANWGRLKFYMNICARSRCAYLFIRTHPTPSFTNCLKWRYFCHEYCPSKHMCKVYALFDLQHN